MTKNVILCEGKTDAILLSYYLERTQDWHFEKQARKRNLFPLPVRNEEIEVANWYTRGDRHLAIWGVGGKDNFQYATSEIVKFNRREDVEDSFERVVIVTDRDIDELDDPKVEQLGLCFSQSGVEAQLVNRSWVQTSMDNRFGDLVHLQILTLIIPFDKTGAVETFLLGAMSDEDAEDKNIVQVSTDFVSSIDSNKYLLQERMRVKAELAVTLAVMYPDKVFTPIHEMSQHIPWEQYRLIQDGFELLEQI